MKPIFSRITLIRLFCFLSGLLVVWFIISPTQNHSIYHWEIIFGLNFVILVLMLIEYNLKKRISDKSKLFSIELLILLALVTIWRLLVA